MNDWERIADIAHFRQSSYGDLDVPQTLDYMRKRYIDPIKHHVDISDLTLMDCGAGYGWLSFSYLLNGGRQAILCDVDSKRLEAAGEIAAILAVDERCKFICSPMQELELADRSVDIFASVETLEHVRKENIDACVRLMAAATRKLIILTTPNKLFPLVMHDTKVPFAHWLPPNLRKRYVRLFGRVDRVGNDFVSPWRLAPIRQHFRPVSTVLTFPSTAAWESSYPYQSPYGKGDRWRERPPGWLKTAYALLALVLGRHSYILAPNLCRIWLRKEQVAV
jgi:hypothetical protein